MNLTGVGVDDPDVNFYENYYSTSDRNYTAYKNPEVDRLIDQQSAELDIEKRKKIVWDVEKKLADDIARPIIGYNVANTCWSPQLKGLVLQQNSIYNGWRFEDVCCQSFQLFARRLDGAHDGRHQGLDWSDLRQY